MADTSVRIEGLVELGKRLNSEKVLKAAKLALKAGAIHLQSVVDIHGYPPLSEANQSRGWNTVYSVRTHKPVNTWYQRGTGTIRIRKDGSVKTYVTSRDLGHHWSTEERHSGLMQVVGVSLDVVPYAKYVQKDGNQAWFHKMRHWKTERQAADEEGPRIVKYVRDAIEKSLAK